MSERPTKTITTPTGVEVEVFEYLTGRDMRAIQQPILKMAKIDLNNPDQLANINELDPAILAESENALITAMVKSVNGNGENIIDSVLDLNAQDYTFIVNYLNEFKSGISSAEKKS